MIKCDTPYHARQQTAFRYTQKRSYSYKRREVTHETKAHGEYAPYSCKQWQPYFGGHFLQHKIRRKFTGYVN
jgi:hypothetical protein